MSLFPRASLRELFGSGHGRGFSLESLAEPDLDPCPGCRISTSRAYLPGDILTKVDRMSMANSLEARVPLLDHRLVEFACGLPADLRMRSGASKYLLKRALRGRIPPSY